eukprot:gene5466-640_t
MISSNAVDGVNTTCTHTAENTANAWWMVDLQSDVHVFSVTITNRYNQTYGDFTYRLGNFDIRVGNTRAYNANPPCISSAGFPSNDTKRIECTHSLRGRYIFVQQNLLNEPLTICEISVN